MLMYGVLHPLTTGTLHNNRINRIMFMAFICGVITTLVTSFIDHVVLVTLAAEPKDIRAVQGAAVPFSSNNVGFYDHQSEEYLECSLSEELGFLLHDLKLYRSELSAGKQEYFNGESHFNTSH